MIKRSMKMFIKDTSEASMAMVQGVTTYKRNFGPVALTATLTTNVYQGGQSGSALIYDIIRQLHFTNKTGTAGWVTLYLGGTGANSAGTELFVQYPIPANGTYDWFGAMKMFSTDFLVGGANAITTITVMGLGEQYVV